jgi:hypothetical protein
MRCSRITILKNTEQDPLQPDVKVICNLEWEICQSLRIGKNSDLLAKLYQF